MSDLGWIIFLGVSAAVPVGILVWMARPRLDDSDPPYRRKDYYPQAQRLPREPAPLPADPKERFFVKAGVEGAIGAANRRGQVSQVTVSTSADGNRLIVTGGKGVGALVTGLQTSGALDFFTSNRQPNIEVKEDPTLGKREEWSWTGSRLDQVPPSIRHFYDED